MSKPTLTHKVVLIGNSAVGKTSIINQYIYNSSAPDHTPTVGIDFFAKTLDLNGQSLRLQIWDTAGQEKFHSLIPSYIRNSTVAVFVFDITSENSFEDLEKWYKMVEDIANPKLVVVGNKVDLEEERKISEEDGKKFADAHQAFYIETSARTPTNIDKLFEMISQIPTAPQPELTTTNTTTKESAAITVDETPAKTQQSGGCC